MRQLGKWSIGVDVGSSCTKAAVLDDHLQLVATKLLSTGWNSAATAEAMRQELAPWMEGANVVATGYGRAAVSYAQQCVTEITCHAKGAVQLFEAANLTVIDIGGQDTKIIRVENGNVADFLMNDKCSAGTGRFLEIMAATLGMEPGKVCELAAQGGGVFISSMCTVFAESEMIGLIGKGEKRENLAFAVIDSMVSKTASQAGRLSGAGALCLTGGLSNYRGFVKALSAKLGQEIRYSPQGRFAGAVGAALQAAKGRPA